MLPFNYDVSPSMVWDTLYCSRFKLIVVYEIHVMWIGPIGLYERFSSDCQCVVPVTMLGQRLVKNQ